MYNTVTTLIGDIGEEIIFNYLTSIGYEVKYYGNRNSSHDIDLMVDNGKETFLADVKTKRCMEHYPVTGIDSKDYINYKRLSKRLNMDVFIYFVDYHEGWIYGNFLDVLDEYDDRFDDNGKFLAHYPNAFDGVIYFPLDKMIKFCKLSDEEVELLRRYSKE